PTGRRLGYGALVDQAATLPVPPNPPLKDPKDWRLIGTPAKRLDSPDKVNGAARFGIDERLPGMKVATLAACPVFGGQLASVDDTKARAVPGVRQVVRLEDAVAVVADHMWAAKQGLAALDIKWDEGPNAKLGTADIVQQLAAARARPGAQPSPGRRLRATARGGLRPPGGTDRHAGPGAHESRMDPRGRHPARYVPAVLLRPHRRRPGRARPAGRLDPSRHRL